MEQFRKNLIKRILFVGVYSLFVCIIIILGILYLRSDQKSEVSSFITGFNFGCCVGIQLVMLYYMAKYIYALRNNERLQSLYIQEHDERTRFIFDKMGGFTTNVIVFGLLLATLIAGFFEETTFFTLLGAVIFCGLIKNLFYIYYNRKY